MKFSLISEILKKAYVIIDKKIDALKNIEKTLSSPTTTVIDYLEKLAEYGEIITELGRQLSILINTKEMLEELMENMPNADKYLKIYHDKNHKPFTDPKKAKMFSTYCAMVISHKEITEIEDLLLTYYDNYKELKDDTSKYFAKHAHNTAFMKKVSTALEKKPSLEDFFTNEIQLARQSSTATKSHPR